MGTVTGMTSIAILATSLLATNAWADPLDWYKQQLFEPSRTQLAMEKSGRIMIYNGLHDRDVQRALDEQFDRVESMMFTGTIVTDERGEPAINRETGEVLVENDGCD
ncbi:MAG: hypothetical protein OEX75_08940 [Gammaproteobacteria bacterium]|nr:hypothetical protein [Gammaproteobacteria bacterium]